MHTGVQENKLLLTTDICCYILFIKEAMLHMNLIISNSSMEPIYEQIVRQVKSMIIEGKLKEETVLPSVRTLSKDLKISALTVKKAYDCLEQDGFIITVHGKGSFVAPNNKNLLQEEQKRKVESMLELAIQAGRHCGMKDAEIRELLDLIMEE